MYTSLDPKEYLFINEKTIFTEPITLSFVYMEYGIIPIFPLIKIDSYMFSQTFRAYDKKWSKNIYILPFSQNPIE